MRGRTAVGYEVFEGPPNLLYYYLIISRSIHSCIVLHKVNRNIGLH